MLEKTTLSFFTLMGVILILVGVAFLLIPILAKLGLKTEELHPLILLGKKFDGVYVGTSPILILILVAIYILLALARRG